MGKYDSYLLPPDAADLITQKVAQCGNRAERRKVLKALNKTNNILTYTQKRVNADANRELDERSKDSFGYIMAMFAIVLHDKYHWTDDGIEEMITEVNARLTGEWSEGKSVQDVARELEEKTGIELRVE